MYIFDFPYRVTYSDTDMMGYLYYGNYARLYEIGRVETIRSLGFSYRQLEDEHKIMLPVVSVESRFLSAAKYDELLNIRSILDDLPTKMIIFRNEIYNSDKNLIHTATVKLFFIDMIANRRISCPDIMTKFLKQHF